MATMCEELVGLLTMLPGNWLVNDYVFGIGRGDAWRQYLYGLRKTCRPKSPADLPAKSHSQIHSEPLFTCRLSFLTGRVDIVTDPRPSVIHLAYQPGLVGRDNGPHNGGRPAANTRSCADEFLDTTGCQSNGSHDDARGPAHSRTARRRTDSRTLVSNVQPS